MEVEQSHGTSTETCKVCHGTGQVRQVQNTILGQIQTTRTCSTCNGEGKIIKEPCIECKGRGKVKSVQTDGKKAIVNLSNW